MRLPACWLVALREVHGERIAGTVHAKTGGTVRSVAGRTILPVAGADLFRALAPAPLLRQGVTMRGRERRNIPVAPGASAAGGSLSQRC